MSDFFGCVCATALALRPLGKGRVSGSSGASAFFGAGLLAVFIILVSGTKSFNEVFFQRVNFCDVFRIHIGLR